MCKYCENNEFEYTEYIYEEDDDTVRIYKLADNKYEMDIDTMGEYGNYINVNFPINFCPKCGRELS